MLAAGRRRPTASASVVRSSYLVALLLLLLVLLLFHHSDIIGADGANNYYNNYQYSKSSPFSSPNSFPAFDPYKVLGLSPSANSQSIKLAYRKKALETHPDKQGNGNGGGNNNDDSEFIQVQESYDMLIDPVRRRQYDQHRRVMKVQQEQERRKQEQKRRQQEWLLQQQRQKQREKLKKQQEQQKWQERQEQQRSQRRQQQQRASNSNQNSNSRANQQVTKLIVVNEHNQPINLYRLVQRPFHHFRNQNQYDLQLVYGNIPPGGLQTLRRASNLHLGDVLVARDVRVDGFLDDIKDNNNRNSNSFSNHQNDKSYSDSTILFRYTLSDKINDVDKAKLVIGRHYHHRHEATNIMNDSAAIDSVYTSDCYDLSSKCLEMNNSPSLNCETFPEFMTHMCRLTCKKCHRPPPISSRRGKNNRDSYRRQSQFRQHTNEEDESSFSSIYSILSNFMTTFRHVDAWYDILVRVDDATEYILAGCRSFAEKLDEVLSYREYALLAWVMLSFITGLYSVLLFNSWIAAVCAFIPWILFTLVGTEQVQNILYSPSFLDGFLEDTMHIVQHNFIAATCFLFLFYAVGVVITMTIDRLTDLHPTGNKPSKNSSKCAPQIQNPKTRRTIDASPPIVQSSSSSSSSSSETSPEKTSGAEINSVQQDHHALQGVPVHLKQE